MKKVARTLRRHEGLILNWFRAKGTMSCGVVEGFNYNVKLTMRKSYGFRTYQGAEVALYHRFGKLPEPELTHRFCGGGEKRKPLHPFERPATYCAVGPEVALAGGKFVDLPVDQAHVDRNYVTAPAWPAHAELLAKFLKVLG